MKIGLIGDSLTEGRPGVSFVNILKNKYPNFTLDNLGKPGESVKSLHTRLQKMKLDADYDLTFLWIGVNDMYSKLLRVQAQPVAKDHEEFREIYTGVLENIISSSNQVIAVSPGLVGENLMNASNKELKELSSIIQNIISKYPNAGFLDMQSVFQKRLSKLDSSDYISKSVIKVMKDVFFCKNSIQIDKLSKKRGLHLTLDGIHLNSNGAAMVAEEYAFIIERYIHNKDEI